MVLKLSPRKAVQSGYKVEGNKATKDGETIEVYTNLETQCLELLHDIQVFMLSKEGDPKELAIRTRQLVMQNRFK